MVQLAARRACAAFLRRPVGVTQATISVGTEEETVVHLVIALLEAGDLCEVPVGELTPEKARPAGGVMVTSFFGPPGGDGAQPTQPAGGSADAPTPAHDDGRARRVGGVPRHGGDPGGGCASRPGRRGRPSSHGDRRGHLRGGRAPGERVVGAAQAAAEASRISAGELFPRLLAVSREPGLSEADQFDLSMDTGLSRGRIRTGAKILGGLALVAAAEAFAAGRDPDRPAGAADRAAADEVIAQAITLMRDTADDEKSSRLLGALSIAAIARSAPDFTLYATGLLFSGDEQARTIGATCTPGSPDLFRVLASDPSPRVRTAVASRAAQLPDDVSDRLAGTRTRTSGTPPGPRDAAAWPSSGSWAAMTMTICLHSWPPKLH